MERKFLKDEHDIFRKSLRTFLEQEAAPYIQQWEEEKEVPRIFWKKMGKHGFLCPQVSEIYSRYSKRVNS